MIFRSPNCFTSLIVASLIVVSGCWVAEHDPLQTGNQTGNLKQERQDEKSGVAVDSAEHRVGELVESHPEIHNLIRLSDTLYSGGEPVGEKAFESLARLGVTTVVSVDGSRPDIETASKFGLRYVHIPIGYDGVKPEAGLALARLVREAEGPLFVHCHHGVHRGPAAAAVACMASGDMDSQEAIQILERVGTSKEYAGLWRDVKNYQVPALDAELPELVEVAEVGSVTVAMTQIHRAFDNLKLCRDANWLSPKSHPDLVPAQEALLLKEGFRESSRNLGNGYGDEIRNLFTEAEASAQALEDSLKSKKPVDEFSRKFQLLGESCKQCHVKFRN